MWLCYRYFTLVGTQMPSSLKLKRNNIKDAISRGTVCPAPVDAREGTTNRRRSQRNKMKVTAC
jgi:hypothetical protein